MNKNIKIVKNTWDRKTLVFIQYLVEFSGEKLRIYNISIEIKMTLMLNSFIFFTSKNDVHSYKSCNTFIHMSTWQVQWTEIIPVFIVYMKLQSSKNRRHKKILIILIIEKKVSRYIIFWLHNASKNQCQKWTFRLCDDFDIFSARKLTELCKNWKYSDLIRTFYFMQKVDFLISAICITHFIIY